MRHTSIKVGVSNDWPSSSHLPVARFVEPAEFDVWRDAGLAMGFAAVAAGPFVRSSYNAEQVFRDRDA